MSNQAIERSVMAALSRVVHPDSGKDVVSAGYVRNLTVGEDGQVRFSFQLRVDDPGSLVKEARRAAEAVDGVSGVKINVQLPQTGGSAPAGGRRGGGLEPGSVPAPSPRPGLLPGVSHIVAVSSGKGGVGKSMVATNLAVALAASGQRVGLLDADIYGPNIPLMFGETRRPQVTGPEGKEQIAPLEAHGVRLMSLGFLLEKEQPAIMRGPLISGILKQFLEQVDWGELDVMVVDMPPGTGDAQLSLVQTIDIDGAVMVTTPQDIATGDVLRGIKMFERVNTPVLGIVENMAGYECPHCGETVEIFGMGGGERLAAEVDLPFLGRVPLDPAVARSGDEGTPTVAAAPESPAARALKGVARALADTLARAGVS
ncbi:MAG: Mrp/NBP35 family ATP-binding protein [Gemmatimonadota bacterium]|jgi:ATP-binding protein involved in chromosome partitioning